MVAFIFSLLLSGVVAVVLKVINPLGGSSQFISPSAPAAYIFLTLGLFGVTFIALAFIVYVSLRSDLEDYYSWLRKKLVGIWKLDFDTYRFEKDNTWTREKIPYIVQFYFIDRSKKLTIRLDQENSDVFEDRSFRTNIVHIGEANQDDYILVILFEAKQELKKEFATPFGKYADIEMKTLFEIKLHYNNRLKKLEFLDGKWFDINNVLFKIVMANGSEIERTRISDELYSGVDPFMGKVEMKFVGFSDKTSSSLAKPA